MHRKNIENLKIEKQLLSLKTCPVAVRIWPTDAYFYVLTDNTNVPKWTQTLMVVWNICTHQIQSVHALLFYMLSLSLFVFIWLPQSHRYVVWCTPQKPSGIELWRALCCPFNCTVCVCGVSVWLSAAVVYSEGQGVSSHWLAKVLRCVVRRIPQLEIVFRVKTEADGIADC